MRGKEMLDVMENLKPEYIEAAAKKTNTRMPAWLRWGAVAACLCLTVAGILRFAAPGITDRKLLHWSENFRAENYFKYNLGIDDVDSSKSIADIAVEYGAVRYFSDSRAQLEADGVIPSMPDYPLYDCAVFYREDGSIIRITHAWHKRGDAYSDLTITMGEEEVKQIQDCIDVEVDDNGNIVPPSVTVTERDGIRIVTQGNERQNKTMTFRNDTGWYQIAGSWNDSYEPMAELLDWVWEHPVDFERFTMDQGVEITDTTLAQVPDAFADQIPDFEALGYILGENYLQLKDGELYAFEGHYYTGVTLEQVKDGSYLDAEGWREIHWCIDTQPDCYDLQDCLGELSELTQGQVAEVLASQSNFSFMRNGVFIKVYCKDAGEAWRAVEALKN